MQIQKNNPRRCKTKQQKNNKNIKEFKKKFIYCKGYLIKNVVF